MGCKVIFAPRAIADLAAVVRQIARDNPDAALRVGNALIEYVEVLETFPLLGTAYSKRAGIRKLIYRPYLIFYRPNEAEGRVEILRYWHSARGEPDLSD
jgi:toxin ParE1/3/4